MTITPVLLGILACYRVTQMLVYDDGPSNIFANLRAKVWEIARQSREGSPGWNLGRLFDCPYCMGVWVALAISLIVAEFSLINWLAISGGQAIIESLLRNRTETL
jgi:hypothetical protein